MIGSVFVSVLAYAGLVIFLSWPIQEFSISQFGTFGDSFGLLTSLFSGLAFAGLIITIIMQKEELTLQREELELTRRELSGQKEEMRVQNQTLKLQKFENTFFQMLSFHNEILNGIDIERGTNQYRGRDAFKEFYRRLVRVNNSALTQAESKQQVSDAYTIFFKDAHHELGHYFRHLYSIIKFVDRSDTEDKRFYTNLVRAQISSYELVIIFYNCLSAVGEEKFKPLVEKYALLKALPSSLIHKYDELAGLYEAGAYRNT